MKYKVSNNDAGEKITRRESFSNVTGSFTGESFNGTFTVKSYATVIGEYRDDVWWINDTTYSNTTSDHHRVLAGAIGAYSWSGDDNMVHTIKVPRGASSLPFYAGQVAHERACRLAS